MYKNIIDDFNAEEQIFYNDTYLFIKGYATGRNFVQTLKALPLARKFHNGQYRKAIITVDGEDYKLPYVLHVLKVCSTLMSLELPLEHDELDVLFASALLHDCIEDCDEFKSSQNAEQTMLSYGLTKEVYDCVNTVSKMSGCSDEQLNAYFNKIKLNKLTLLIKLADRSHNVEDLYNMKTEKLHKYVNETRTWIYPLATYGKANYPELSNGITILKSKIVSLTECTETIVDMYEAVIREKDAEIERLKTTFKNA
ncbi:bifunctional (p)ppGpp synthetase/guanosine-3',5'-bis(diphosphate) 3'-pyrophosphohydrolase [bacterium]|nr:bifunctional (p)ppGpp synthetase/guanosine-3',5'-bis(diphosphate) 3'-pyrophosphohydrolase [bacterium]